MNVKKLPKEKRNKVILVWVGTVMVVAAWAFVVLSWQLDSRHRAGQNLEQRRSQFMAMTNTLARAEEFEMETGAAEQKLHGLESQMANAADAFSWVVTTVRNFKQGYTMDLPQFSQVILAETTLLPKFPYRQASVTVSGTAYFHDIGMFVADFENQFPFARIINLDIEPGATTNPGEREKLNFKMDIIFLVKPNAS
jgi:Tfp pilus assembly protein PilO